MAGDGPQKLDSSKIEDNPAIVAETTPLLGAQNELYRTCSKTSDDVTPKSRTKDERSVFGIISVLLIGVFVSSADVTLVMATFADIASDFHALESGSWLLSSYGLAACTFQPLYGKLSDIFGRKCILQSSYVLFTVGTLCSGFAQSMAQMILARVIQGAGSAGMVSMVSVLLTDLVPLQEVAVYRSYVNIFSTVGRSCGGLIGGYLAEAIGWRWAFLCQAPLLILSIILVWWRLEDPKVDYAVQAQSSTSKWKRIDFLGASFMSLTILPVLLAVDLGGKNTAWDSPLIIGLLAGAVVCGIMFFITEKYLAREPVFPLKLLGHYVVVTSYLQILIQSAIQTALLFSVPLYFQATNNASTGEAGAHLIPAIVGNTVGGLVVGAWIKRTGRYKIPTVLATCSAILAFTLLIILWRGHTNIAQSCVIFFGGLGNGMAQSSIFIGLTAGIERENTAIATSGLFLSSSFGTVVGVSAAGSIFQSSLRWRLNRLLSRETDGSEVIKKVMSDVGYLRTLRGRLRDVVVHAFVMSIQDTFHVALVFAGVALVIASVSRQSKFTR